MFDVIHQGDCVIIEVIGDVDPCNHHAFKQILEEPSLLVSRRIVLSFLHCTYMDAATLSILVRARKTLGSRLQVAIMPGTIVSRILSLSGLDRIFVLHFAISDALNGAA